MTKSAAYHAQIAAMKLEDVRRRQAWAEHWFSFTRMIGPRWPVRWWVVVGEGRQIIGTLKGLIEFDLPRIAP